MTKAILVYAVQDSLGNSVPMFEDGDALMAHYSHLEQGSYTGPDSNVLHIKADYCRVLNVVDPANLQRRYVTYSETSTSFWYESNHRTIISKGSSIISTEKVDNIYTGIHTDVTTFTYVGRDAQGRALIRVLLERDGETITDGVVKQYPREVSVTLISGLDIDLLHSKVAENHRIPEGLESQLARDVMGSLRMQTNNIANFRDGFQAIQKFVTKGPFGAIGSLSKSKTWKEKAASSWLAYRYSYLTTKSDVEEIKRYVDLNPQPGSGCRTLRGGVSDLKLKIVYADENRDLLHRLWLKAKEWGLAPDLYNLWDMVPLSFVVDWFTSIGSSLEDFSNNFVFDAGYYSFDRFCWSWKWTDLVAVGSIPVTLSHYERWVTTQAPAFEVYEESVSTGTVIKRVFDGISLIVG